MVGRPPESFVQSGDDDPLDTDPLAPNYGWIGGCRMVSERAPSNWAAYAGQPVALQATGQSPQSRLLGTAIRRLYRSHIASEGGGHTQLGT